MKKEHILKRSVIKEELVSLTCNYITAIILNQLIYWSERVRDFDKFLVQEKELAELNGEKKEIELTYGWIYKPARELSDETMLGLSDSNIRKHLKKLIEKGFISERRNPKVKWDKTMQYKINLYFIEQELNILGYHLDGYAFKEVNTHKAYNSASSKIENGTFEQETEEYKIEDVNSENTQIIEDDNNKTANEKIETDNRISKTENPISILENGSFKIKDGDSKIELRSTQNRTAIPENILENTLEREGQLSPTPKLKFLDCIYLSNEEYKKLVEEYGEQVASDYIKRLNNHIESKGQHKRFISHYHALLTFLSQDNVPKLDRDKYAHMDGLSDLKKQLGVS